MKRNQGFTGKGFKFDETEAMLAEDRKKIQLRALGLQDSDDEDGGVDVSSMDEFGLFLSCKLVLGLPREVSGSCAICLQICSFLR